MARFKQFIRDNAAPQARRVSFVPGNLFFTRTLALPEGMRVADIDSFAELTLEGMSPFSLEHLAWGYVTDVDVRWLLIMAVCRPRVAPQELDAWGSALFVLPGFYPLLTGDASVEGCHAILHGDCLTIAHYEQEGCPLPTSFTHHVIEADGGVEAEALEVYAAKHPKLAEQSGLLLLREGWEERDGGVYFDLVRVSDAEELEAYIRLHEHDDDEVVEDLEQKALEEPASAAADTSPEEAEDDGAESEPEGDALPEGAGEIVPLRIENLELLWPADLRESFFKKKEQQARRLSAALWKSMLVAGIVAAVLVIGVCVWGVLAGMIAARHARIEREAPDISALELKEQNLNDLKQFAGSPFRPFDILDALNRVIRNKMPNSGIYFDSVVLDKDNTLSVRGNAGTIVEVNKYADELKASGWFEEVNPPDYQSRGSEVRFTLDLRYLPPSALDIPEEASAPADGDTPSAETKTAEPDDTNTEPEEAV